MTAIDLVIQRSRAAIDGQFSQERLRVRYGNGEAIGPLKENISSRRINAARGRRVAPSRVRHLVRTGLHASTATASQHWLNAGRLQNESMLADIGLTYSEIPRPVRFGRR